MMKKIIQCITLIFVYIAISFVEYSYAYKENPTQPEILDLSNNQPIPNYSTCVFSFHACGAQNYSSFTDPIYLADYCGDPSINEIFSLTSGDPFGCAETEFPRPIDCKTCDCPSGQHRDSGMCVPDAAYACDYGIANYLTGECYPQSCPNGDGSPEDCRQVPACIESENTTLITFPEPASCECTGGLVWNPNQESCVEPQCDGENNSPINSIFEIGQGCVCPSTHLLNTQNNICEQVSCSESDEIFVSSRNQCEVAVSCDNMTETLITSTNTCRELTNASCEFIDQKISWYASFVTSSECYFLDRNIPNPLPEGCLNVAAPVQNAIQRQYDQTNSCNACVSSGGIPYLFNDSLQPFPTNFHSCANPEDICGIYDGEWNSALNICMNANDEGIFSPSSSASSQSNSASSQSNSSSSSASSINSGGGSGSSSGSNTSTGSGGNSSTGGGSNGNGSASSAGQGSSAGAGECDPESKDYLACISPNLPDLPDHTQTDSGYTSIDQVNEAFLNRISNSPIVQSFEQFSGIITVENAECPLLEIDLTDTLLNVELSTDIHCQIFDLIRPVLTVVMLAVFAFLGFRIFASA